MEVVTLRLTGPAVVARSITADAIDGQSVGDFRRSLAARLDVRWRLIRLTCAGGYVLKDESEAAELRGRSVDVYVADEEEVLSRCFGFLDLEGDGFVDGKKFLIGLRTLLVDGEEIDHEDLEALEVYTAFKHFGTGAKALIREEFERLLFYEEDDRYGELQRLLFKLGGV